jgi:hypothetical protein
MNTRVPAGISAILHMLTLKHHLAFELREAGEDGENELASGALGVDHLAPEVENAKASPAILNGLKPLHDLPKADRRTGQSVDLGDDQGVATTYILEGASKFSAFGNRRNLLLEYLAAAGRLKVANLGWSPASCSAVEVRAYPTRRPLRVEFDIRFL